MSGSSSINQGVSKYRWVVMGVWFTSAVTGFMVVNTLGILLPSISDELNLSPSQQGMLGSAAFWGNLVLAIPLGWWASRFRPKILTAATLVLGTLFIFVQSIAPIFLVLLIGRLGFGLTILAREPARAHLIRQWFAPNEAVIANSISNVLFGIIVGGGLVVTPILLQLMGNEWRLVLRIFVGAFMFLTVLWVLLGRERQVEEPQTQDDMPRGNLLKSTMAYRDVWVVGFGFAGVSMSWASFLNFYPTMMLDQYGISLGWSGGILAIGVVAGGASGLAGGYYVANKGGRKTLLKILGLMMVSSYFGMIMLDSIPLLILFSIVNGIAWGFFPILYSVPFVLPGIRSREVAIAVSFTTFSLSAGSVLGSLSAGFLQEAIGDLRLVLFILSFSGLSLTLAGFLLRIGDAPNPRLSTQPDST